MKNLVDISIFFIVQFIFITLTLMYLYQGGSLLHPDAEYFIINENYLSDLGRCFYFNGNVNPFSIIFTISLSIVGVGIALFFYIISKFCHKKRYLPIIFGSLSAIGYIGISVFWVDINYQYHLFLGKLAYLSFFIATLSLNLYMKKDYFPQIYYLLAFLNIALFIFLTGILFIPKDVNIIKYSTISQKIIVIIQVGVAIRILYLLKKLNNKINIL